MQLKTDIVHLVQKESPIFGKLDTRMQKRFLHLLQSFLRKKTFVFHENCPENQAFRIKTGIALSTFCISENNKDLSTLFHTIEVHQSGNSNVRCTPKPGTIVIRYSADDSSRLTLHYDVAYGIYHQYLISRKKMHHFSEHLGRAEMILTERMEFQTTEFLWKKSAMKDDPASWFAAVSSYFIMNPDDLRQIDSELYDSFCKVWDFDFTICKHPDYKSPERINTKKLHPIYSITILSIFISTFILFSLCQVTLLPDWLIFFIVGIISLSGYFFRPLFKKYNIPIIIFPYILFCVFAVGVNITALFLYLNKNFTNDNHPLTIVIPKRSELIHDFHSNPTTASYIVEYQYKKHISRHLTFQTANGNDAKFFIIEIKNGLFGIPFISDLSVISSL